MQNTILLSPVRVFLLIENRLLREALTRLLRRRSDILIVGQGNLVEVTHSMVVESNCSVLVLDSTDPNWLPVRFFNNYPCPASGRFRALLVGMESDTAQFLNAIRAGASGYMLKDASANEVVAAVRAIVRGEATCTPQLCAALFNLVSQLPEQVPLTAAAMPLNLTLRQRQLVNLLAKGLTNKEIAAHLNLSEFTVRNHIHRILKLADVRTRREAVGVVLSRVN
jgi:DNA-binding NarL/FixJ family response regulator